MPQPLMLRLDAEALAALFPPDTQARVDLQNAVVAEFIRKNFRDQALGSDVRTKLEGARADALAEVTRARKLIMDGAFEALGMQKDRWDSYKLNEAGKAIVAEAARAVVRDTAIDAANTAAETFKAKIEDAVRVRLNQIIDSEARAVVRKYMESVVAGVTNGTMAPIPAAPAADAPKA